MTRLKSLDALRGFDMLLIMGLGPVVVNLCVVCGWGADCALARQFEHVEWNGLRLEDTIFPLFLFLAGVSWPFSCSRQVEKGASRRQIVLKCLKRAVILFTLGLVHGGLLDGRLRMGSVLGRIGLAWFFGSMLYLYCRIWQLLVLSFLLPIGYWLLLAFVPAPDALTLAVPESLAFVREYGTGSFSIVGNLSGWVDRHIMPGVLQPYTGIADNQSVLGVIPAVGTALFGILSGELICRTRESMKDSMRLLILIGCAATLIVAGITVATSFGEMSMPVNKKLWSASFAFIVGGYSILMLAVFHWIVDVIGCEKWIFFFEVIGMNSITIYLAQRFIPFDAMARNVFGGVCGLFPQPVAVLLLSVGELAISWLFLFFLYRKKVFLKV